MSKVKVTAYKRRLIAKLLIIYEMWVVKWVGNVTILIGNAAIAVCANAQYKNG